MIEIIYSKEKEFLRNMPQEVQETIEGILQILDSEYGANRNKYEDDMIFGARHAPKNKEF